MNAYHMDRVERLSEYLDGTLEPTERAPLEAHLAGCPACAEVLEDLRGIAARVRDLPERRPPRDLWPDIAAAIGGGEAPLGAREEQEAVPAMADGVIPLPTGLGAAAAPARRKIALAPWQLTAAAAVLVAVSVGITAWAGPARTNAPATATGVGGADAAVVAVSTDPPAALSQELAALEAALEAGRDRLDPNTVRIIRDNLDAVERAIEESRRALALDPGNDFLTGHLNRAYERKIEYLRDATRVLAWEG